MQWHHTRTTRYDSGDLPCRERSSSYWWRLPPQDAVQQPQSLRLSQIRQGQLVWAYLSVCGGGHGTIRVRWEWAIWERKRKMRERWEKEERWEKDERKMRERSVFKYVQVLRLNPAYPETALLWWRSWSELWSQPRDESASLSSSSSSRPLYTTRWWYHEYTNSISGSINMDIVHVDENENTWCQTR